MIKAAAYLEKHHLYSEISLLDHEDAPSELISRYEKAILCRDEVLEFFHEEVVTVMHQQNKPFTTTRELHLYASRLYAKALLKESIEKAKEDGEEYGIEI